MWYKKKNPQARQLPHTHTNHLNSWGGGRFCSLLKLEGAHIQKDMGYEIIDSLQVKGRSLGHFNQVCDFT